MESFIENHGLLAIFLIALFERDGTFILGGIVVYSGAHSFFPVLLASFSGVYLADTTFFLIGWRGNFLIKRFKKLGYIDRKLNSLRKRFGLLSVPMSQFLFGLRTPSMLIWGIHRTRPVYFFFSNAIGCLTLAIFLISAGYLGGSTAQILFGKMIHLEKKLLVIALALILLFFIFKHLMRLKARRAV